MVDENEDFIEEMDENEEVANAPEIDVKEILESVKLKESIDEDDTQEIEDKPSKKKKNKVVTEIVDNGNEDDAMSAAKDLYSEFSNFLEKKAEIKSDIGVKQTISTGIDLVDAILGGGFAIGALNMIVGQPGSGKTMLAIQTLAQGQQQYNGKLLGMFLDSEEATTTMRLANLGVKYPKIKPYTDITVEKVFKVIEALALFKQEKNIIETPGVVVWDSIANTLTQKERETDDPNTVIGYKARLLSILVPKYVAKCAQNNICFLSVNQLRDNLQMGQYAPAPELKMMGANKTIPGGNILRFNAFQLVEMKVKSIISPGKAEDSSKYGFEGTIVKVKCVKNKLFSPNVEVEIVGSFINGFSNFWTNYNFLKNVKRLNSGAWNYLVSLPNTKFRAKDAVETYNTDPEFKAAFDQEVKDAINIEIVEKYK
jgi:RecA/RadA recombinase